MIIHYRIREFFNSIRYFFRPRQRWLTKVIPNHWCDKTELIYTIIETFIIHFVEGENALKVIDWNYTPDQKKFAEELQQKYDLIKNYLPALQKELQNEWDKIPPIKSIKEINNRETDYSKINELEEKIDKIKTDICVWMVSNREYFRT